MFGGVCGGFGGGKSAFVRVFRDTHNSSLKQYKGTLICHYFWREIVQTLLMKLSSVQVSNAFERLCVGL